MAITVTLQPPEAVAAGARWRLAGDKDWRESGVACEDLTPGLYVFEFKSVEGWITPDDDRPVWIPVEGSRHIWPFSYLPTPRFPIEIAATRGGFVVQANCVSRADPNAPQRSTRPPLQLNTVTPYFSNCSSLVTTTKSCSLAAAIIKRSHGSL